MNDKSFRRLAVTMAASRGDPEAMIRIASQRWTEDSRLQRLVRSGVTPATTGSPPWSGGLIDQQLSTSAWLDSMRSQSAFEAMFASMRPAPMGVHVGAVTSGAYAHLVGEGGVTPVTRASFDVGFLEPQKVTGLLAVTNELARFAVSETLIDDELRAAVASATDRQVLAQLANGVASVASSGDGPGDVLDDLRALLEIVSPRARSGLFLVCDAPRVWRLATMKDASGRQAFPDVTVQGGQIGGVQVLPSDGIESDSSGANCLLVDARAIAADRGTVTLDVSSQALLQMDDAPADPVNAAAVMTSMFQTSKTAVRATRWFGMRLCRASGVAVLTGATW